MGIKKAKKLKYSFYVRTTSSLSEHMLDMYHMCIICEAFSDRGNISFIYFERLPSYEQITYI